ncbi:hypothetical protein QN277_010572 [Acacia crassicarpa]|uniref:Protein yippee-like n=1 Tax=Acacia crassicarpa TaxID=499986 RepID=A0AAE1INI5_9FABA|nr:hypothetical protein QN277_010572 [Acacia crassicarpa]
MGRVLINLEGVFYSCKHCNTDLAHASQFLLEESFGGRHGRTYLFNNVVNVTFGEQEEREMMGGLHTVVDIFCFKCGSNVGWKFLSAQQQTEEYKVGKFILKRSLLQMWVPAAAAN